MLEVTGYLKHD